MSHKGLKPLAQQFPYAAVMHDESLSFTTHRVLNYMSGRVRESLSTQLLPVSIHRGKSGPLKWRERDQKNPSAYIQI